MRTAVTPVSSEEGLTSLLAIQFHTVKTPLSYAGFTQRSNA